MVIVKAKSKWQNVKYESNNYAEDGLISIQKLEDYEIINDSQSQTVHDDEKQLDLNHETVFKSKSSTSANFDFQNSHEIGKTKKESKLSRKKRKVKDVTPEESSSNKVVTTKKSRKNASEKNLKKNFETSTNLKKNEKNKLPCDTTSNEHYLDLKQKLKDLYNEDISHLGKAERAKYGRKIKWKRQRLEKKIAKHMSKSLIKKQTESSPKSDSLKNEVKTEKLKTPKSNTDESIPSLNEMSSWQDLNVPEPVLKSLSELGFVHPTPIQALSLPAAIRYRKDILGAAETGSGKTLAFAIPLVSKILDFKTSRKRDKAQLSENYPEINDENEDSNDDSEDETLTPNDENTDEDDTNSDEDDDNEDDIDDDDDINNDDLDNDDGNLTPDEENVEYELNDNEIGCVSSINNVEFDWLEDEKQEDEKEEIIPKSESSQPFGLILTPTRELALQVRDHIQAILKYTDIQIVAVVGGMAIEKQTRLLNRKPEIVVATPGRLWELIQKGHSHLKTINKTNVLVIDEADRMIEKGHFEELSNILDKINADTNFAKHRQTFVYSATLTMIHQTPLRIKLKKKKKYVLTEDQKLGLLIEKIKVKDKPKIIDLTKKTLTTEKLLESKIMCMKTEKDMYLYYFLLRYPGRTLVFANSIDCIRRLKSIFSILKRDPYTLHADMHQRQRLKNLDRFKENRQGVLLATDVAARGLDIPDVQHVIHYQVPRTSENYVHRSGRTARAEKEGLSLMLVSPDEMKHYRKIVLSLKKEEDLLSFPVEFSLLKEVKERLKLALEIDKLVHRKEKKTAENNWFVKAAQDMDIELDDSFLNNLGDSHQKRLEREKVGSLQNQLYSLLKTKISTESYQGFHSAGLQNMKKDTNLDALTDAKNTKKNYKRRKE